MSWPGEWEADVLLSDGSTAHLRPISPDDAGRLVDFYGRVSDRSKYLRFFVAYPVLSSRDVERFTTVDHVDRVAFVVLVADQMIAVGRYDRIDAEEAEVAFLVEDAYQGRGLGSVLLEHLAQAGRERGVRRFVAEVLPQNSRMIKVFRDAGYSVRRDFGDGVVSLTVELVPTESSLEVMRSREHRAEARSMQRLLHARSVAVVGANRDPRGIGHVVVDNLLRAGFDGSVHVVNPRATEVAGLPAHASLDDVPGEVDLAVVAVHADAVPALVPAAARKGVRGLVVLGRGYAESGPDGRRRQRDLVALARSYGMRVVGPNCLGIANGEPGLRLNASLAAQLPPPGPVGLFAQSGAFGVALVDEVVRRGLGLSTFVSAGNRADVSGNDLMQYWAEDPGTDVVLLYLESLGNPRKFARVARGLSRGKPVVAVRTAGSAQGAPLGQSGQPTPEGRRSPPAAAVDAMFRQAGVVAVPTVAEMFDVAQVLVQQPRPHGPRVAVVGNSDALAVLTVDVASREGLEVVGEQVDLGPDAGAAAYDEALGRLVADPGVDSVVVLHAPSLAASGRDVAEVIARHAAGSATTVVTTFVGGALAGTLAPELDGGRADEPLAGRVPAFRTPEEAVRALARATGYADWRATDPGEVPELDDVTPEPARQLVRDRLRRHGEHPAGVDLSPEDVAALLACYGIAAVPLRLVDDAEAAVAAGEELGWHAGRRVVLKATAEHLRVQLDSSDIWRNIASPGGMRTAWAALTGALGPADEARLAVQPMAGPGVPVEVLAVEDPLFGPLVSVGVAGVTTALLGDRAYRMPPLTDRDAAQMVREVRASPLLLGWRGRPPADVAALEDLLHRAARLTDDLPEVARAALEQVIVHTEGLSVVTARVRLAPPPARADWYARRLGS